MASEIESLWEAYDNAEAKVRQAQEDERKAKKERSDAIEALIQAKGSKKLKHPDGRKLSAVNRDGYFFRGISDKDSEYL